MTSTPTLNALLRQPTPPAMSVGEAESNGSMRLVLILFAALVLVFALAGALVPIGGAVVGTGQIGVQSRVKTVSHPTGGTVAAILVENGQRVRKGQVLIRLDDQVSGADAHFSAMTVDQLVAQKARLEAEQQSAPSILFPQSLTQRTDADAVRAMADERRMFAIRRAEAAGIVAQLDARIGQYREQIAGYRAQMTSLRRQGALIEPERKGLAELYAKKLVTLGRVNQLERASADIDGSMGSLAAQVASAQGHVSETREQILQAAQNRRSEAGAQIAQINGQLYQQQARSMAAADLHDRTTIRAPHDGVVAKLSMATIGGVIRPAEPIMDIVPDHDPLIVEAAISPVDIDQVRQGQSTRVRLSALNSGMTPEVTGHVAYIGADRIVDPGSQASYFPVRVVLDAASLRSAGGVALKPGMPAEVFIETGSRSIFSYISKPLRDQMARAFRHD